MTMTNGQPQVDEVFAGYLAYERAANVLSFTRFTPT
jgi:hypothetical protein